MKKIRMGKTNITVPQNAFGALPVQRCDMDTAVSILNKAYEGGMKWFDTARAYSDSEEKIGTAFTGIPRESYYISTKTTAKEPEQFRRDLETSLNKLRTDYIDVYQYHMTFQCYRPEDGTGMYECMLDALRQGMIRHIGITTHRLPVAEEIISSGLYETIQFPFSYLASDRDIALVEKSKSADMGFIAMKGLSGGLITNARAAMSFMLQYDNVLPIWGIQRESELTEWLAFMDDEPEMTSEIQAFIEKEKEELSGDFCRGCGYCLPCPAGIEINNCARISLMLRRAPSAGWLTPEWQEKMARIDNCIGCRACANRCPYELDTPNLLKKNLADYRRVVAGEVTV